MKIIEMLYTIMATITVTVKYNWSVIAIMITYLSDDDFSEVDY